MEDGWEGSYSTVNISLRPSIYASFWEEMSKVTTAMYEHGQTHIFLNCWYMAKHESYAMWKLYDATGKGVAIRTTAGQLKKSLKGSLSSNIFGSQVQYVDYSQTFIPENNLFSRYVYKRLSFEHEREYRLISMWSPRTIKVDENSTVLEAEPDNPPFFLRADIDLGKLITAVYVSPGSPEWMAKVVTRTTEQYLPGVEVRHSDLNSGPIY
jgi:hypothetical protein